MSAKNRNFNRAPRERPENSFLSRSGVRLLMEPNPAPSTMTSELMEKRRVGKSARNLPKAMSDFIFHIVFSSDLEGGVRLLWCPAGSFFFRRKSICLFLDPNRTASLRYFQSYKPLLLTNVVLFMELRKVIKRKMVTDDWAKYVGLFYVSW